MGKSVLAPPPGVDLTSMMFEQTVWTATSKSTRSVCGTTSGHHDHVDSSASSDPGPPNGTMGSA